MSELKRTLGAKTKKSYSAVDGVALVSACEAGSPSVR